LHSSRRGVYSSVCHCLPLCPFLSSPGCCVSHTLIFLHASALRRRPAQDRPPGSRTNPSFQLRPSSLLPHRYVPVFLSGKLFMWCIILGFDSSHFAASSVLFFSLVCMCVCWLLFLCLLALLNSSGRVCQNLGRVHSRRWKPQILYRWRCKYVCVCCMMTTGVLFILLFFCLFSCGCCRLFLFVFSHTYPHSPLHT
jgi:hypothetical protein